jgi:methyltransferase (TIGR00027 family)
VREKQASQTAEYMAFFRALESARSPRKRLFEDRFAVHFLRPSLRKAVRLSHIPLFAAFARWRSDRLLPGARTSGIARTRFIDDAVLQSLREDIRQVVLLGAGFDCRAYRLHGMQAARTFEVDHPATLEMKRRHLSQAIAEPPPNIRYVAIDFNQQSLAQVLRDAGLDTHIPTLFLWEGVTNYLSAEAVDAVLRYVATFPSRSRLIFTYVHRGALDGSVFFEDAPDIVRNVAAIGEPWTFGLDPAEVPGYLHDRGLDLIRDVGAREYREQCMGPAARRMKGYDFYHVAIAAVLHNAQPH